MTSAHLAPLGDDRTWTPPIEWDPVPDAIYAIALHQTLMALDDPRAVARLASYYDPSGRFAGAAFVDTRPNPDFEIVPSDLWALSTLSMPVPPLHGRELLGQTHLAGHVRRNLRRLPTTRPLTDVDAPTAAVMRELYDTIRTGLPPLGASSDTNQWVFASKLCARKRPQLFPVRDNLVSRYLLQIGEHGDRAGKWGQFNVDIPIYAYLISHLSVTNRLRTLRGRLESEHPGAQLDWSDLRLLDVALWTRARQRGDASDDSRLGAIATP